MLNLVYTRAGSLGLIPARWPGGSPWGTVTLETKGRRSGRTRAIVVTWVEQDGRRYLVSMLGDGSDWVRNVRAAGGEAVVHRRGRQKVRLEEVPAEEGAPILRTYLQKTAISTRRHLRVDPKAPIEEFRRIAPDHPVFQIVEV